MLEQDNGHVHNCLNCKPELIPEHDKNDERYHSRTVCRSLLGVTVNGISVYTYGGVYTGEIDGWALVAGLSSDLDGIHICPECYEKEAENVCLTLVRGNVVVLHVSGCNKVKNNANH